MNIFRIVQFICLVSIASVWASDDFKDDFKEKLGEALKQYNAELLQSNMDGLKEFYKNSIADFELGPRDERTFKMRMDSIDVMKSRIGNSVTPETVKATASFSKVVLFELLMFRASPKVAGDKEKAETFDKAMKKCADDEIENVNIFYEKMQAKWSELYRTIPNEELEKNPEYKEINDLIEKLGSMDKSFNGVLDRTLVLVETLRKISTFFGYNEWNTLLVKSRP